MMRISSELANAIEDKNITLGNPVKPIPVGTDSISVTQRMISACSGSFVTSFVVTPFDVIRIRIQQQQMIPTMCCEGAPSIQPGGRNTLVSNEKLFWQSHHYCQNSNNCAKITSTAQGFVAVTRTEGIASLWRGLSLTLLQAIPSNIIYFTGYEYIRDNSPIRDHFFNPLLCGSGARILSATAVAPIELVKTRLQSIPIDSKDARPKMLTNLVHDMYQVLRQNGIRTMFTGLQITLWRDVPFSGIYWSFYEYFKFRIGKILSADFNSSSTSTQGEDWRVFSTSFLSGSLSGSIAAFITHPFDVGKTRLQIASDTSSNKLRSKKPSMSSFLYIIYKKEGIKALYAGLTPRVIKIAPSCAIMITSYEIGKKYFIKENGK